MPNFSNWLGSATTLSTWLDDVDRANDVARHIADKPSSIEITRAGALLAAQTVRLEPAGGAGDKTSEIVQSSNAGVFVVGYKSHATIADTNIKRGDRFFAGGQMYEVKHVLPDVPDRLIAVAEATP